MVRRVFWERVGASSPNKLRSNSLLHSCLTSLPDVSSVPVFLLLLLVNTFLQNVGLGVPHQHNRDTDHTERAHLMHHVRERGIKNQTNIFNLFQLLVTNHRYNIFRWNCTFKGGRVPLKLYAGCRVADSEMPR